MLSTGNALAFFIIGSIGVPPTFRGINSMEKSTNLQRQFKNTTKFYKCQAIFINLVKESFSLVKGLVKEKSPCDFNAPRIAQNSVQEQFQPHSSAGTSHSRSFQTFRIVGALLKTSNKMSNADGNLSFTSFRCLTAR